MRLKHLAAVALAFGIAGAAHSDELTDSTVLAERATQWVAVTVSETLCRHGTPQLLETMRQDMAVGLSLELDEDVERANFEMGVHRLMNLILEQASSLVEHTEAGDVDCAKGQVFVKQLVQAAHERADTRLRIKLESKAGFSPHI